MIECPTCGDEFDTKRGLDTHTGRVHDPLPKKRAVELFIYQNLNSHDIAKRLDMSWGAVKRRLTKYNLWAKDPCGHTLSDDQGYESITSTGTDDANRLRIHRLIAIAHGADPHDIFTGRIEVDHRNNMKADNRPSNLNVLSKREHASRVGKWGAQPSTSIIDL